MKHPKACPFARTAFGNTSLMYTHMTAPEEIPKKAMKPSIPETAIAAFGEESDSCQATSPCMAIIIAEPPMIIARRPKRSITRNANMVKMRLTAPTPIVPARAANSLPSPKII